MYKQILDQNSIKLNSIFACERYLVSIIDLTVMTEPSIFDSFVEIMAGAGCEVSPRSSFSIYIENYMLHLLSERSYNADVILSCLIASAFYLKGMEDESGFEKVSNIFKNFYSINSTFLKKFDKELSLLATRLKLKGNSANVVDSVVSSIELRHIFA